METKGSIKAKIAKLKGDILINEDAYEFYCEEGALVCCFGVAIESFLIHIRIQILTDFIRLSSWLKK